jgi:hypothetical protein
MQSYSHVCFVIVVSGCTSSVTNGLIRLRGSSVRRVSTDAYMLTLASENITTLLALLLFVVIPTAFIRTNVALYE